MKSMNWNKQSNKNKLYFGVVINHNEKMTIVTLILFQNGPLVAMVCLKQHQAVQWQQLYNGSKDGENMTLKTTTPITTGAMVSISLGNSPKTTCTNTFV